MLTQSETNEVACVVSIQLLGMSSRANAALEMFADCAQECSVSCRRRETKDPTFSEAKMDSGGQGRLTPGK